MLKKQLSAQEKFEDYHASHPEVADLLEELALDAKTNGYRKMGICMLFEVARWRFHIENRKGEFKLPNSHKPFYSRLLMARNPELEGFFETRRQKKSSLKVA